jgi:hypothetical protein
MPKTDRRVRTGGREGVRRFVACVLIVTASASLGAGAPASEPKVSVRESRGVYAVRATFDVTQPAGAALAVLTDYEQIPRFMPDVRTSVVRERTGGRTTLTYEVDAQPSFAVPDFILKRLLRRDAGVMIERLRGAIAARASTAAALGAGWSGR